MTLTDRVVLLTGARRVGAAVAEAVAARGADVAITYNRSRDDAEATAKTVRAAGRRALVVQADVSKEAGLARRLFPPSRDLMASTSMMQKLGAQARTFCRDRAR